MERLTFRKVFDNENTLRNAACVDNHIMHREPIETRFFDSRDESYPRPILGYKHYLCGEVIDKLAEYEDAEEKGLIVILPVAPGETVYLIDNNTDACDECKNFVVGYCEEYCKCNDAEYPQCAEKPLCEKQFLEAIEFKTNQKWILENKDDFGKSIFLTREEAEAALKKMQEGKE